MTAVDVAIVGGGAVGAACARAAALRGLEVAIFEPGPDSAAASPASAGMLAAQIEPGDDVLVALSVRARDLYEPLAPALRETTGIDIGFWRSGIAAVAFDESAADRLKEEVARQRQAVLAAGVWSPQVRGLPHPLPVEPLRGQMAATAWPDGCPPAILYHDRGYVLARGADAVLGSTMERAGYDARVTNEGLAQIFRGAVRLLPALMTQSVQRMWAGLRPATPDGRPILGRDPEVDRLWYATGHGRTGILLAALTGEIVADLLSRGATEVDISALRVDRFE